MTPGEPHPHEGHHLPSVRISISYWCGHCPELRHFSDDECWCNVIGTNFGEGTPYPNKVYPTQMECPYLRQVVEAAVKEFCASHSSAGPVPDCNPPQEGKFCDYQDNCARTTSATCEYCDEAYSNKWKQHDAEVARAALPDVNEMMGQIEQQGFYTGYRESDMVVKISDVRSVLEESLRSRDGVAP